MTLSGESRRKTFTFEDPSPFPETCIALVTVTRTVTDALCARQTVPASAIVATIRKQIMKIPARRRIFTTYTTNQPTICIGRRERSHIGTSDEHGIHSSMKVHAVRGAPEVTIKYESRTPE